MPPPSGLGQRLLYLGARAPPPRSSGGPSSSQGHIDRMLKRSFLMNGRLLAPIPR